MVWQVISCISTDRHVLSSVLVWWHISPVSVSVFRCRQVPTAPSSVLIWCHVKCNHVLHSILVWWHVSPVSVSVFCLSPCAVFSIGLVSRQVSPHAAFGIGLVARVVRIVICVLGLATCHLQYWFGVTSSVATYYIRYWFGGTYPLYPYLFLSVATCRLQY